MRDGRWEIGDERLEIGAVRRETGDAVMRRQVRGLQTSEMLGISCYIIVASPYNELFKKKFQFLVTVSVLPSRH